MKNQTWDQVIPLRQKKALISGKLLKIRQVPALTHKDANIASHILPTNYSSLSGIGTIVILIKGKRKAVTSTLNKNIFLNKYNN